MFPQFSAPLAKSFRTLEGALVLISNVALVIIPIVTSSLSAGQAVKYGVILNTGFAVARSVLKGIAALGIAPAQVVSPVVEKQIEQGAVVAVGEAVKLESAIKPDAPVPAPVVVAAPAPAPQPPAV